MKIKVTVTYLFPLNTEADKKIRDLMKGIGCKWYAQGNDLVKNERDICFDLDI